MKMYKRKMYYKYISMYLQNKVYNNSICYLVQAFLILGLNDVVYNIHQYLFIYFAIPSSINYTIHTINKSKRLNNIIFELFSDPGNNIKQVNVRASNCGFVGGFL